MMSTSNVEEVDEPSVDQVILDAARECVAEFGVKRTTLVEVARRAGVSRPTVYRRWPDTRALIGDLLTRELRETVAHADVRGADGRTKLVRTIVASAAAVRRNPLFQKIFRTDTDLLLTYIVDRLGRSQHELVAVFVAYIAAGQADGSIRAGDPNQLATMLLLIVQSAVQSAQIVTDALPDAALDTELAVAIDGYLRPTQEK
jgi:AcrR family transcriptional regulator